MSAIPKELTRDHVLGALREILRHGVPRNRLSTKHCLVHQGQHFPPKYVISLATRSLTPGGLHPDEFSGGPETNDVLAGLGFSVELCSCGGDQPGGMDEVAASMQGTAEPLL